MTDIPLPSLPFTPAESEPAPAKPKFHLKTSHVYLILLALTLLGAFLRFWRIGFQSYWTDEGYTIVRIRDTFDNMLNQLTDQGFPPGWYVMLRQWCLWIEEWTHNSSLAFSPAVTRSLAAVFGTLTIPAMYFLARQFTDRKGALLVTLLAALNPFLIYYSRDIKMYAALWFFATLNMAIFFQWQTSHRHWLWLPLFTITATCMTAIQSLAWFLIGLQLVYLLTRPRIKSMDAPFWLTGIGIASIFPYYWYVEYVEPQKTLDRLFGTVNAGTVWYTDYTDMNWKTIASLPTSHLFGFLWPTYPPDAKINRWFVLGSDFNSHLATRSFDWLAKWELFVTILLFAILIVGLIPWRGFRWKRNPERAASVTGGRWWWIALWLIIPTILLALTWIPQDSPWYVPIWGDKEAKPLWEPRYLGIIVPAWILWLAASLRRLPTLPVRILAIVFVAVVSILSALTNQLIYRNAPYQITADIAERYVDPDHRSSEVVAVPTGYYPAPAANAAFTMARKVRPGSPADIDFAALQERRTVARFAEILWDDIASAAYYRSFILNASVRPGVKTIVVTDPYGDLTARNEELSDDSLAHLLPGWTLVHEESHRLYYEWRFYIFSTWRTRVWQRTPAAP